MLLTIGYLINVSPLASHNLEFDWRESLSHFLTTYRKCSKIVADLIQSIAEIAQLFFIIQTLVVVGGLKSTFFKETHMLQSHNVKSGDFNEHQNRLAEYV